MFNLGKQLALSHTVASQLSGPDHPRHILKAFQQPSKETFGGSGIPPWLNENVENNAVLIHGAPKIVLHALNPDEPPIKVPTCHRAVDDGGADGWQSSGQTSCTS